MDVDVKDPARDELTAPVGSARVLDALLAQRFTCRGYRSEQVPQGTIEAILRTAQRTASWCNVQPWKLVITRGEGTERFRRALVEHNAGAPPHDSDMAFPGEYKGVYQQRRRVSGFQLYEAVGVARGDREASARQAALNYSFFGAPHVAIVTTPRDLGVYGAVDCGGYVANLMSAAHAHGVATTPQGAIARHSGFIRDYFQIPDDRMVVCGVAFGFADHDHVANSYRTFRADLDQVVEFADA
ncbi:MAG: nitroreductase [Phenylobacterium sp.]|uniref:nitroreductase n=1 Tax=Phenylobacterium sp. TaxID=1871053 RepID=UPI0027330852|nr:nitroreductase [Phenylobacterium sp.]MDP3175514.1 nitroreductase [Phenylobacterium sp.]